MNPAGLTNACVRYARRKYITSDLANFVAAPPAREDFAALAD